MSNYKKDDILEVNLLKGLKIAYGSIIWNNFLEVRRINLEDITDIGKIRYIGESELPGQEESEFRAHVILENKKIEEKLRNIYFPYSCIIRNLNEIKTCYCDE